MGSYVIVMTKNKKTLIIHHSALAFVAKKNGLNLLLALYLFWIPE